MAEIEQLTQPTIQGPFWNPFTKQWDDNIDDITNRLKQEKVPKDSAGVKKR